MYTPSLYGGLISLISTGKLTGGESIGMFSYGSGVAASFYKINVKQNEQLSNINNCFADLQQRLNQRKQITPGRFRFRPLRYFMDLYRPLMILFIII